MRRRRKLMVAIIVSFLLLVSQRWLHAVFIMFWHLSTAVIFAKWIDYFGLPSTLYMANVSCPRCNQFDASYLIEPQRTAYCTYDKPLFLLILVVSQSNNYNRRMAIRQSWGSISAHNEKSIKTFFACGRSSDGTVQVSLDSEAKQWHDVLQVDVDDGALTNKTVASIMWAIGYCGRHFTFLLKTDDISFNVPQHFVQYLDSLVDSDTDNFAFVGGQCSSGDVPDRDFSHKLFVPFSSYPGSVFPHHCKGQAYVMSNEAALRIVAISNDVLFTTLDDVFFTGICRAMSGITCSSIPGIALSNESVTDCDLISGKVFSIYHVTSMQRMMRLWNIVNRKSGIEHECG